MLSKHCINRATIFFCNDRTLCSGYFDVMVTTKTSHPCVGCFGWIIMRGSTVFSMVKAVKLNDDWDRFSYKLLYTCGLLIGSLRYIVACTRIQALKTGEVTTFLSSYFIFNQGYKNVRFLTNFKPIKLSLQSIQLSD